MMTNLMTISVKKASISSKPTTVYLSCPPLCGLFSIQQNAKGGLSCKVRKNVPRHILAPSAVACDIFLLRASAHPAERFLLDRKCDAISYQARKMPLPQRGSIFQVCSVCMLFLCCRVTPCGTTGASGAGATAGGLAALLIFYQRTNCQIADQDDHEADQNSR